MLLLHIETLLVLIGYLSSIQLSSICLCVGLKDTKKKEVIGEIPKEKYENIFKGAYERPEKYVPRNITRFIKRFINNRRLKC
jgi:hypothetical protein